MSDFEKLVPELDLCKQIPAGAFDDSVLVWSYSCDKRKTEPFVDERDCIDFCRRDMVNAPPVYPAPTLQEILADMAKGNETLESHSPELNYNDFCGGWIVRGRTLNIKRSGIFPDWIDVRDRNNPVTAALKLWLELNNQKGNG